MPWWGWVLTVIASVILTAIAMVFLMIAAGKEFLDQLANIDSLSDSTVKKMNRQNERDKRKREKIARRNLRKETNA